jgi:hypothetical protein
MGYFDGIKKVASGEGNGDDWLDAAGAVTGAKVIGDAFGAGPSRPDTSGLEGQNADLMKQWGNYAPVVREQQGWNQDYNPSLLDSKNLAKQGPSGMSKIATNPKYDQFETQALQDLQDRATQGLTSQDKLDLQHAEGNANRQVAGRNGALQQSLAERGLGGGGLELVGSQMNAQDADNRAQEAALSKAAMVQQNRQSASQALGSQASALQAKSFGQQAQQAQAQDTVDRFNTQNTVNNQMSNNNLTNQAGMYNNQGRQGISNANVNGNNGFAQQRFANEGDIAKTKYNANTSTINGQLAEYGQEKQAQAGRQNAILSTVGGAAGSFLSDETEKKNIKPVSEAHVEDFLASLSKPKTFEYKDPANGVGTRTGVMAQDLHSAAVQDRGDGKKQIDVGALLGDVLASLDHLNRKK